MFRNTELSYNLSKKWYAVKQNYSLKKQLHVVETLLICILIIWLIGSSLTVISQMIFEPEHICSITDCFEYAWAVIIELVSGFDIPGDLSLHWISRLISLLMLLVNLTVVALFTAQIITTFTHFIQKAAYYPQKPLDFKFKKPIIICGINEKLMDIVAELRKFPDSKKREIVIIDKMADKIEIEEGRKFHDVWFVKGNPMDRDNLKYAIGSEETHAIILAPNLDQKHLFSNSVNSALALETFAHDKCGQENNKIYTVLEVRITANKFHFKRTTINEWICVDDFSMRLLSQAVRKINVIKCCYDFMGNFNNEYINRIKFDESQIDEVTTYEKAKLGLKEISNNGNYEGIILGFVKLLSDKEKRDFGMELRHSQEFIQLNPSVPERIINKENQESKIKEGLKVSKIGDYNYAFKVEDKSGKIVTLLSKETPLNKGDRLIVLCREKNENFHLLKNRTEPKETIMVNSFNDQKKQEQDSTAFGSFYGHTIICNWNKNAEIIIREVHAANENMPVAIISTKVIDESNKEIFSKNVITFQGNPADADVLQRANIDKAGTVIVLADDDDPENADSKSILISLAVDSINPDAYLIVELEHSYNEKYFRYTHVDEVICLELLGEKLLAQSALTPGLSLVYKDLLTQSSDTNEIYLEEIPLRLIGENYKSVENLIMKLDKDIILIGLSIRREKRDYWKKGEPIVRDHDGNIIYENHIYINPTYTVHNNNKNGKEIINPDYIFDKGDKIFMISYNKPGIDRELENYTEGQINLMLGKPEKK